VDKGGVVKQFVMVVVVAVGFLGCASDAVKSPGEKCDDLVSSICDRIVECIPGASGMHADCVQVAQQDMTCTNTRSVGPTYDRCMDELDAVSCSALFPTDPATGEQTASLPPDCNGVISSQAARRQIEPGFERSTPLDDTLRSAAGLMRERSSL
jgi:hypothetical protein